MEVRLRKSKSARCYCDQDTLHGKTEYQLIIKDPNYIHPIATWLCPDCLIEFKNKIDKSIGEIKRNE